MSDFGPWAALALLGVYHGVNPAMGWLFAVALGLQERSLRAVLTALLPIAAGHELSVLAVALLVSGVLGVVESSLVRAAGAVVLVLFGLFKLLRPRSHPRWVGMRVTLPELGLWSFRMSSAHGAGLMLFPLLLGLPSSAHAQDAATHGIVLADAAGPSLAQAAGATLVHSAAMLLTMALVAVVVYVKVGTGILRKAWLNLDGVWAAALIVAGLLTLLT